MAFAVTARHVFAPTTTDAATATSNSTTPTASSLFVRVVAAERNYGEATEGTWTTPSEGSLSYTSIGSATDTGSLGYRLGLNVHRAAVGGSPSAFTIVADYEPAALTSWYAINCLDITGHDTGTPVRSGSVGTNGALAAGGASVSGTVVLGGGTPQTPTAGNLIVVVFATKDDNGEGMASPTAGSGKTFTAARSQTGGYCQTGVFYRVADGAESSTITCSDFGGAVYGWAAVAFEVTVGASSVTGTSAQTLAAATSSASGWVTATGTAAITLAALTSAATGSLTLSGTSAQTLAAATSTATGTLTIPGSSAQTLADATSTATGNTTATGTSAQTLAAATSTARGVVGSFPYAISGNSRYLTDHAGKAWPIIGDAGWSAVAMLTETEQTTYLDQLDTLGYNATLLNLVEHTYLTLDPGDNEANQNAWTGTAFQSSLNSDYWTKVDNYVAKAAARGITVLAFPAYIGFSTDGWSSEMAAATNLQMYDYGAAIAARYLTSPNIVWVIGGDRTSISATLLERSDNLAQGIKSVDTVHLMTGHTASDTTADAVWGAYSWLQVNTTYRVTEATLASQGATGYADSPTRPVFDIEGKYDNDETRSPQATAQTLRQQAWTAFCTGGFGHVFGNAPRWGFGAGYGGTGTWQQSLGLNTPGTLDDATVQFGAQFGAFLLALTGWESTTPDTTDTFLTSGESTGAAQAVVRFSADLAVLYMPTSRETQVDLSEFSGSWTGVRARKYDPTDGSYTAIGSYATVGSLTITAPGNNASTTYSDWVYVFDGVDAVVGSSAQTLAAATSTATGNTTATGTSAQTLAAATSDASGTSSSTAVTGTSAQTLAAATSTATGNTTATGTSAQTLADATSSATGTLTIPGSSAQTLADATSTATGSFTALGEVSGTSAITLAAATSTASGSFGPSGTSAQTLTAATSTASGTFGPSGTSAQTLAAATSTAAVWATVTGTSAQTLAAATSTATGTAQSPYIADTNPLNLPAATARQARRSTERRGPTGRQ